MPFYIQRRVDPKTVQTLAEFIDPKEAHRVAREYNISDPTALHYVTRVPCKSWQQIAQTPTQNQLSSISSAMMKPRFYKLLEQSVDDGARRGYARARKHTENPTEDHVIENIVNCIMGELHENFTFGTEDE